MTVYWVLTALCIILGLALSDSFGGAREGASADAISDRSASGSIRVTAFCVIAAIALTVLSSVRFEVGYDYYLYARLYYNANFMSFEQLGAIQRENGFMFLFKILSSEFYDYRAAFVFISLLIYPVLMLYVRKNSPLPWLGTFAFITLGAYYNSLNFIRQFIAALICAFALKYVRERCFWRFAVIVLLASAFHRSALILIPLYFVFLVKWNGAVLLLCTAASAVCFFSAMPVIRFANRYIYKNYDALTDPQVIVGLSPVYAVIFGLLFAAAFLLRKRFSGDERQSNAVLWCSFFNFFFELMGVQSGIVSRFALLFIIPSTVLAVPLVCNAFKDLLENKVSPKKSAVLSLAAAVICCCCVNGILLLRNYNGVVPYKTIFDAPEVLELD